MSHACAHTFMDAYMGAYVHVCLMIYMYSTYRCICIICMYSLCPYV